MLIVTNPLRCSPSLLSKVFGLKSSEKCPQLMTTNTIMQIRGFFLTRANLWIKACTFNLHRCASFRLTWRLNWLTSRICTMWFWVGYDGISKTTRTHTCGASPAIWQFNVSEKKEFVVTSMSSLNISVTSE